MTPALRLTLQPDAEHSVGLECEACYDGFAGRGMAWFAPAEIEQFCDALGAYPLAEAGASLIGGYGEPSGARVVTLGLSVRPTNRLGALDLVASLAEGHVDNLPSLAMQSAQVRIPVTYEALRPLSRSLRALLAGRVPEATLDAPHPR
jgi:hypothetical protein